MLAAPPPCLLARAAVELDSFVSPKAFLLDDEATDDTDDLRVAVECLLVCRRVPVDEAVRTVAADDEERDETASSR